MPRGLGLGRMPSYNVTVERGWWRGLDSWDPQRPVLSRLCSFTVYIAYCPNPFLLGFPSPKEKPAAPGRAAPVLFNKKAAWARNSELLSCRSRGAQWGSAGPGNRDWSKQRRFRGHESRAVQKHHFCSSVSFPIASVQIWVLIAWVLTKCWAFTEEICLLCHTNQ